jgi:Na+/H+ antiporter NhaA
MIAFLVVFIVREYEIQYAYGIDAFQIEVPVRAALTLLAYGKSGVEYASVFKIALLYLLHLNDELLAVLVLAIYVENSLSFTIVFTKFLAVEVLYVLDDLLVVKQGVQETDEQVLVHLRTEKFFETEVGIRIDVSLCSFVCHIAILLE